MTRKITELEKITNLNQMKVGEYYRIGGGDDHMNAVVKCIYVDLFGLPVFLYEDRREAAPIKITESMASYYLTHRGMTHVKVEQPQTGFCWLVSYIYPNDKGPVVVYNAAVDSLNQVNSLKSAEAVRTIKILSIKKVQWTEGENDFDASV